MFNKRVFPGRISFYCRFKYVIIICAYTIMSPHSSARVILCAHAFCSLFQLFSINLYFGKNYYLKNNTSPRENYSSVERETFVRRFVFFLSHCYACYTCRRKRN